MSRVRVTWHGPKVKKTARKGAKKGLTDGTEHLLAASTAVVPIEEATLERSGVASVDEATMTGAVSYDGPYAVRQHEDLTFRHDPGRQAKYLEQPMLAERDAILTLIAAAIRRGLRP